MRRTKITYTNHEKSNYIRFLLPHVTGTKPKNVLVYKQQNIRRLQHSAVPSLRNHVQYLIQWLWLIRVHSMAVNRSGPEASRSILAVQTLKRTTELRLHTLHIPVILPN
jgi:hypothetical protein